MIKEACLKAIGTGFVVDPRELRAVPESAAVFRVTCGAIVLCARLLEVPGHVAAVAARTLLDVVMP